MACHGFVTIVTVGLNISFARRRIVCYGKQTMTAKNAYSYYYYTYSPGVG